jgi:hypothetical protein
LCCFENGNIFFVTLAIPVVQVYKVSYYGCVV